MAGGQGYFETGAGQAGYPSGYSTWMAAPAQPGTDQWGYAPAGDTQGYSGMPPLVAAYPGGAVPVAAPIPVAAYPPAGFPHLSIHGITLRLNPSQHPSTHETTYLQVHNHIPHHAIRLVPGGVGSPVVPPAAYASSPYHSSSSLSSHSFPPSSSSRHSRSRSDSTNPTEREARLYDRPVDTVSRTLDERIRFVTLREPPVLWDLRDDLSRVLFRELKRPVTGYDFTRFTTEPPTPYMKLYHTRLPWYIEVTTTNGVGVTFHDLFTHIQRVLSSRIKNSDFYNNEITQEDREKISRAWKERCQYNQGEMGQGVKKVDYLMRDCIFVGLTRGREGMWEIKTRKV
ncbi:hypothetical protein BC834DRAFT_986692 [Gloeopeniophorella convolvens]|nr:hypothetical protein BC834DRAFT_986692 [Gloeopeniophorella convolvens]